MADRTLGRQLRDLATRMKRKKSDEAAKRKARDEAEVSRYICLPVPSMAERIYQHFFCLIHEAAEDGLTELADPIIIPDNENTRKAVEIAAHRMNERGPVVERKYETRFTETHAAAPIFEIKIMITW